jgi:hypothetical protein
MVFMRFLAIQLLDCDVFILNVAERFLCRTDYFNWPVFDGDMIKTWFKKLFSCNDQKIH